jgi:NTE family protein
MSAKDVTPATRDAASRAREHRNTTQRIAVVAAGAGARGAFEAGALSVLVPWLTKSGKRPTVFVGTSAGAINAALLAATAHLTAGQAAESLLKFWRSLTVRKVYRCPVISAPGTLRAYLGQLVGRAHVVSLLDTTPLVGFAEQVFAPYEDSLRDNIEHGKVEALALVATDASDRTTVFADLAPGMGLPGANLGRAIDYRRAEVTFRHVLASSAIPVLFHPIGVDGAYYTDGGVRLNAPLAPAVALGATRVAVVATHPETYSPAPAPSTRPPGVVDSIAGALGSLLADRMVEDMHTLDKLNDNASGGPARLIPRLFVGPKERREVGELAAKVYAARYGGLRVVRELDFRALHWLIGAREKGNGDLLSYIFFDQSFIEAAIQLGIGYASKKIRSAKPWRP